MKESLQISTMVFENGTSGYLGITSSIYLNWKISVIFGRIDIKLVFIKAEWWWLLFRKKVFFYVTSGLVHMTSFKFQLRISFSFYFGLSYNLFRVFWVVNVTLRSFKILCDLEGHIDIWGQWQGQCIFFLYRLICQFITTPILDRITPNFQLSSVKKGTSGFGGIV